MTAAMVQTDDVIIQLCDCTTPLGDSLATWAALVDGRSNIALHPVTGHGSSELVPLSLFDAMAAMMPPRWFRRLTELLTPVTGDEWGRADTPIFISSSNFGVDSLYYYRCEGATNQLPYAVPHSSVEQIRQACGWGRNVALFSHACVSAHLAILAASHALRQGARKALVVSYDFVSPFVTGGFHALKILNNATPCPFHAGAHGSIALGEGAAYLVLGRDGEGPRITGQTTWNEMYHFTANDPSGSGFRAVLEPLLPQLQGVPLWIKGHGTGTLEAGRIEAQTLARLFPGSPLTGWKGAIGHTLGSCCLVELAIALQAMANRRVPGTVGGARPCFSDDVALAPFALQGDETALLLSNAFGGAHAALCVRHA